MGVLAPHPFLPHPRPAYKHATREGNPPPPNWPSLHTHQSKGNKKKQRSIFLTRNQTFDLSRHSRFNQFCPGRWWWSGLGTNLLRVNWSHKSLFSLFTKDTTYGISHYWCDVIFKNTVPKNCVEISKKAIACCCTGWTSGAFRNAAAKGRDQCERSDFRCYSNF